MFYFLFMQKKKKINLKVRQVSKVKKNKKDIESIDLSRAEKIEKIADNREERKNNDKKENLFLVENLIDSKKKAVLEEARKRKILWAGVAFVMLLVVFVWGYSLKKSFANNKIKSSEGEFSLTAWTEMTKEIDLELENLKKNIEEINNSGDGTSTEPSILPQEEVIKNASSSVE